MCGDAQASPKCEPCDPELAGAGESVEEASVPHALGQEHSAWAYLLDNPRLALMLLIKAGYDSLTDGSQLTMHKFDTWTAEEQRALVCRFLIDKIGEGVLPVIVHASEEQEDAWSEEEEQEDAWSTKEELDAMSRITELFRVAGSDAQQRLWNSYVNDADVSLLTLISRGL